MSGLTLVSQQRKIGSSLSTMRSKQPFHSSLPKLVIFVLVIVMLVSCQGQPSAGTAIRDEDNQNSTNSLAVTPTNKATATVIATPVSAAPTSTAPASATTLEATARPSNTQMGENVARINTTPTMALSPTEFMSPTLSVPQVQPATESATPLADSIDRTCPDPPPEKPDYNHYYLDGDQWPNSSNPAQEHFWLSKPLPGAGRFLYTDWLPYGYDAGGRYLLHTGVDSAEPAGTAILAAASGTVVVAGDDYNSLYGWRCDWYGHLVVIELDDRWLDQPVYVLYGHVLGISVSAGERVERGQKVAEVGVGGAATLPHLHLEVRVGSNEFDATRNPFLWMAPPPSRGLIVGRLVDPEGRPWQGVTVAAVGRSENTEIYRTWTYLDDPRQLINPDENFAENFVIADVLPGDYEMYIEIQDEIYQVPIIVKPGELVEVEIISQPYKMPSPTVTGIP